MHTLVEDVLPYLVVFYLVDSLALVRAAEWALLAPGRRFRLARSGLHLVGLSPFAQAIGLFVPPLLATGDGVLLFDPAGPVAEPVITFVPIDGATAVSVDGRAVVVGSRRVATPGPRAARRLAAELRSRPGPPPPAPSADDARSDFDRARERRAVELQRGPLLHWLGLALFVVTFGLLPASLAEGAVFGPGVVLLLLLGLHVAILVLAWTMLRRCGLGSGDTMAALGPMLFFPPAAIHASSHLSRDLYLDLDPLAAAAAILPARALAEVARPLVRRVELLSRLGEDTERAVRARLAAWRGVLEAAGTSLGRVIEPPVSSDPSAALYCPLCSSEYRAGFSSCSDCGIPLLALAAPAASESVLLEA